MAEHDEESRPEFPLSLLERIIPFRFLTHKQRIALLGNLTEHTFEAAQTIIAQGDTQDRSVYLLAEGSVETLDLRKQPHPRLNVLTAGHYFGERAALFDQPRQFEFRALETTRCYSMSGERFLGLLRESRVFAQVLGNILRDQRGIFEAFDRFTADLVHQVDSGHIHLSRLVPLYQNLEPALHPLARDPWEIDFSALTYAVTRLPDNVTDTFVYYLTDNLPALYSQPSQTFRAIPTVARRRSVYEMLPGKNMVLLRYGLSDLMDLVTLLCLYTVEVGKIRLRLREPANLLAINQFLSKSQLEISGTLPTRERSERPYSVERSPLEEERVFLQSLSFSEEEAEGLCIVWPGNAVARLHKIALHYEDYSLEVHKQTSNFSSRHSGRWITEIGSATRQLIGHDPSALPPGIKVHVIISNTHSVANCLNPHLVEQSDEILDWGRTQGHELATQNWSNPFDQVYALTRDYLTAHPERADRHLEFEQTCGISRLHQTAYTGIQAQLIDTQQLCQFPIDPGLPPVPKEERALILNIDYAFGEQAREIIRTLLALFARNLASINVLGKAGALQGSRGDILLPTAFIEQKTDQFETLPDPASLNVERLQQRVADRAIHAGPLLTVAGTLFQNRLMLHFYRRIWECVGLEMEGSFYCRQILESHQLGVIAPDIVLRFLYYVSDLPLAHDATLSARLRAIEGVPPLYAITREILTGIFEQEMTRDE